MKKKNLIIVSSILVVVSIALVLLNLPRKVDKYNLKIDGNNGDEVVEKSSDKELKVSDIEKPKKDGYEFKYWTSNGKKLNDSDKISKDTELVAVWEAKKGTKVKKYKVTFIMNNGKDSVITEVEEGNVVTLPKDPTKKDYSFNGWNLNGKKYDFNLRISSDLILIADWVKDVYIIKSIQFDSYSPDRTLEVYKNNKKISVSKITYTDGILLCDGKSMTVNKFDIKDIEELVVVLSDGTSHRANLIK